ncbi:unnamed protein product [Dovyalis caffra]|uniref:Uncharacterized protein n=1 Tax=Dovyalis caffra TaxID=77055 RepID=A0AAV1SLZ2_9ROSI|nr:unnamed protein product [Dovyalis caffra]
MRNLTDSRTESPPNVVVLSIVDRERFHRKLEFSMFSGVDLGAWIFHAKCYFSINKLIDGEKLEVAVVCFEGEARCRLRFKERDTPFSTWANPNAQLLYRFRLSATEAQSHRDQGLCYRCDEKWHIRHRYKNKELHMLLVSEGRGDEKDSYAKSFKKVGSMQGVVLKLQGLTIVEDFLPLKLGDSDMILGLKWLSTLGETKDDWCRLTMTIKMGEKIIVLQGDPA